MGINTMIPKRLTDYCYLAIEGVDPGSLTESLRHQEDVEVVALELGTPDELASLAVAPDAPDWRQRIVALLRQRGIEPALVGGEVLLDLPQLASALQSMSEPRFTGAVGRTVRYARWLESGGAQRVRELLHQSLVPESWPLGNDDSILLHCTDGSIVVLLAAAKERLVQAASALWFLEGKFGEGAPERGHEIQACFRAIVGWIVDAADGLGVTLGRPNVVIGSSVECHVTGHFGHRTMLSTGLRDVLGPFSATARDGRLIAD